MSPSRPARRPRIGLTAWLRTLSTHIGPTALHTVSRFYVSAVEAAGGIPIVFPAVEPDLAPDVLEVVDGLIVTGGEDVASHQYGEEPHPKAQTPDPRRDAFEIAALHVADERNLPTFCICRGIQVLNVARGGTLIQDVPDEVAGEPNHSRPDSWNQPVHDVGLDADSRMAALLASDRLSVNSMHHQAVDKVGAGLRAVGWAPEGFVEAVEDESPDRFLYAVQWHPETLYAEHPQHLTLFRALVEASQ